MSGDRGECRLAGDTLRRSRKAAKVTLRQLAIKVGLGHSSINYFEFGGRPSPDVARAIFDAVLMSPADRLICIGQWAERAYDEATEWSEMAHRANSLALGEASEP